MDPDREPRRAIIVASDHVEFFAPLCDAIPTILLPVATVPVLEYMLETISASGVEETLVFVPTPESDVRPAYWARHPLTKYVASSRWADSDDPRNMKVLVHEEPGVVSAGDVLRWVDEHVRINKSFLFFDGPVVSNANFAAALRHHDLLAQLEDTVSLTPVLSRIGRSGVTAGEKAMVILRDTTTSLVLGIEFAGEASAPVSVNLFKRAPRIHAHYDLDLTRAYVVGPQWVSFATELWDMHTMPALVASALGATELYNRQVGSYVLPPTELTLPVRSLAAYRSLNTLAARRWFAPFDPCSNALTNAGFPTRFAPAAHRSCREPRADVSRAARISDSVLGESAVIAERADVSGSTIGRHASIGPGAVVVDCVLLEGAVVGANSKLHGVVVGPNAVVREGAIIAPGSVLLPAVAIPAESIIPPGRFVCPPGRFAAPLIPMPSSGLAAHAICRRDDETPFPEASAEYADASSVPPESRLSPRAAATDPTSSTLFMAQLRPLSPPRRGRAPLVRAARWAETDIAALASPLHTDDDATLSDTEFVPASSADGSGSLSNSNSNSDSSSCGSISGDSSSGLSASESGSDSYPSEQEERRRRKQRAARGPARTAPNVIVAPASQHLLWHGPNAEAITVPWLSFSALMASRAADPTADGAGARPSGEVFQSELTDMVLRAIAEGNGADNLAIEVKGLCLACHRPQLDGAEGIFKSVLRYCWQSAKETRGALSSHAVHVTAVSNQVRDVLPKWMPAVLSFTAELDAVAATAGDGDGDAPDGSSAEPDAEGSDGFAFESDGPACPPEELEFLYFFQDFAESVGMLDVSAMANSLLYLLLDLEVCSAAAFSHWASELRESDTESDQKFIAAIADFIDWVEAEEDSEDEDDDSGSYEYDDE
jgi:NDP-sugar pyrophosphorylase family protein